MSGMTMREEPECIKKWKLEQEEMLKKKDADEEQRKEELRVKAAQELADWYKQYEEQLAKTRKANKEQEAATVVPEVNGIVPGQEWERVSKHCDFSAKVLNISTALKPHEMVTHFGRKWGPNGDLISTRAG